MTDPAATMRTIMAELNAEFFERSSTIEAMIYALLAGEHVFLLGPPGTAKSLLARRLSERITGARYWEILLDRQLPQESLFGPVDIKEFEKTGAWHRRVDGYLPTAHIAFLDEVGKSGPATLNPMLTALNERLYHNNSKPMKIPLLSAFGASNEELEMPESAAMWDRWLVRVIVESIQEASNFAALISSSTVAASTTPTTIDLPVLTKLIKEVVPAVAITPATVDSVLQLRSDLRAEQIAPSDRRWKAAMRLVQASAFLRGDTKTDDDDLAPLRYALWDVVEQLPKVEAKVLKMTSPLVKAAIEISGDLDDIERGIDERKGKSTTERAAYGGEAKNKADKLSKKVNDLVEKANRSGRSTAKLDEVKTRLRNVKVRILVECLNLDQERAERASGAN